MVPAQNGANQRTPSTQRLDVQLQVPSGCFVLVPVLVRVDVRNTLLELKTILSDHWPKRLRGTQPENVQMYIRRPGLRALLSGPRELLTISALRQKDAGCILVFKADFDHLSEENKKNLREYATSQHAVRSRCQLCQACVKLAYADIVRKPRGAMLETWRSNPPRLQRAPATMQLALTSSLPSQVTGSRLSSFCS